MNETQDEKALEAVLKSAPLTQEPSDQLMRNLRVMVGEAKPKPTWWRSRLSLSACGIAVLAIGIFALAPTKANAKSFESLVRAAQSVNAFQFSITSDEKGKKEGITIAGEGGRVFMNTGEGGLMEFAPGRMSFYDPKENKIVRMKFGNIVDPAMIASEIQSGLKEGFKEMDLKKMLKEYGDRYGRDQVKISPIYSENGKSLYNVQLASKDQPERIHFKVDSRTDLPYEMFVEAADSKGGWKESMRMQMRFGQDVDTRLLKVEFPKNAKVEEIDMESLVGDAMKEAGEALKGLGKNEPPTK